MVENYYKNKKFFNQPKFNKKQPIFKGLEMQMDV